MIIPITKTRKIVSITKTRKLFQLREHENCFNYENTKIVSSTD